MEFSITWRIELNAESFEDAARKALEIQRDPDSSATVFEITQLGPCWARRTIDLHNIEEGK